jgi:hypothetical protein
MLQLQFRLDFSRTRIACPQIGEVTHMGLKMLSSPNRYRRVFSVANTTLDPSLFRKLTTADCIQKYEAEFIADSCTLFLVYNDDAWARMNLNSSSSIHAIVDASWMGVNIDEEGTACKYTQTIIILPNISQSLSFAYSPS